MLSGQSHNLSKIVQIVLHITLCDPSRQRVEGVAKDGVLIPILVRGISAAFIWPQAGEYWTARRENYSWVLNERIQGPNDSNPPVTSIKPGEGYFHATKITLSDGSNVQTTKGLQFKEGTNASQGVATLVAGIVVVPNTLITANSRIQLTSQVDGGTPGFLRVSSRIPGTSFTITSNSDTDTSIVAYQISAPAI